MKKYLSILLAVAMLLSMVACAAPAAEAPAADAPAADAPAAEAPATEPEAETVDTVYYLNFKPEIAEIYEKIGEAYKAETGVTLKVVTAAAGTYEETLKSEVAKSDAPALFQLNGPVGYMRWKEYCADLKDTELYEMLSDKSLAVKDGEGVYGIPYAVEGYGIIYNNAIMTKYFATANPVVASMDEINSFDTLKAVVEDMTAKAAELGIKGVFASTSLKAGEDWRWQTHLMNMPLYYEFKEAAGEGGDPIVAGVDSSTISFKYADNFKNIFDLYLNNSVSAPKLLGAIDVNQSMAEFALGQCAMVQNGNWGASQILGVQGCTVANEDIKFLPIYTGIAGEETQGLCVGTENYFAVNSKLSEAQQKAAVDFVVWLFSSETGKKFVKEDLGFIAPFSTIGDADKPADPLAQEVLSWMSKDGVSSVVWTFAAMPSQAWKDHLGANLLLYAQGQKEFADIVTETVADWATEWATLHAA